MSTSLLRRIATVLTLLACAAALLAPAPATAAGKLSMEKARQTAKVYAQEICLADAPRCKGFTVGKCVRLGTKKVVCKTTLHRKQGETCRYKLTLKKADGAVRGKVGEITCTGG